MVPGVPRALDSGVYQEADFATPGHVYGPDGMRVSILSGVTSIGTLDPTASLRWRTRYGNTLVGGSGKSRWRSSPDPLAFLGGSLFRSCGPTPSQVAPDTAADEEEGEPRRRGDEHLDNLRDPLWLPERREPEREDEGHAQRGEYRRNRHHSDPYQQAQTPSTHATPPRPRFATASSTA